MRRQPPSRTHERWAYFRHSVVGPLLAAPPPAGELRGRLEELAATVWTHPVTGEPVRFGLSTIERWYYAARGENDPVRALRRKVREDHGRMPSVPPEISRILRQQRADHPTWSYQLHRDELAEAVSLARLQVSVPSRATVQRFLVRHGLSKVRRTKKNRKLGAQAIHERASSREVRSFEASHVHGLWHSDFHGGSLQILLPSGRRVHPQLLVFLDDRSRLVCHAQWFLDETAESFVHALMQAIQKRGLPRELLTDNGSAMKAGEVEQGLQRLGVHHSKTLPYCPYQNGKQESFWGQIEGRLLAMLEGVEELTLPLLNEATLAWVEREYHRKEHSEIREPPLERFIAGPDVGRPSPSPSALRDSFAVEETRSVRQSDGSIALAPTRFEIPGAYRHFREAQIRYASWDLSRVHLVCPKTGDLLCRIFPVDKTKNADGRRRHLGPTADALSPVSPVRNQSPGMASLLRRYLEEVAATGRPPAYIPQTDRSDDEDENGGEQ